nr:type II toxin-antitoxin system HicB family antitoxin [Bacteroidota bacterium]
MKRYLIIFEKNELGHYGAYVLDLPGCVSFGDTLDEAKLNITEAIAFHIEGLKIENLPIPEANSTASMLQVAV